MRTIKIKQRDLTDCGASCLASVAAFHKLELPVARIRQLASTDKRGTNLLGMMEAAQHIGLDAKGVRGDLSSLYKIPKPAIAHVIVDKTLHHYVVLSDFTSKAALIMDPADGEMHRMPHEDFMKIWTGVLLLLWPNQTFTTGNTKIPLLSRFWSLIKPHQAVLTQAIFGALVYTLLGLSTAIFVQKIVDYVLADGNQNLLNLMSVIMLALVGIQLFIGATKSILTLQTGRLIDARLILSYYKHMLGLPQQFFDTMRTGEILSRINDAVKIRVFINDAAIAILVNLLIVLSSILLMMSYHVKLALIAITALPLYLLIYVVTNRLNKRVERTLMEQSASMESQLVESIGTIVTVKSFGLEMQANQKTEARFIPLLKTVYRSGLNSILSANATELVTRSVTVLILWAGSRLVLENEITPGMLLSFYALVAYFTGPVGSLIGMNKVAQNALIAADRLFEIMDLTPETEHSNKLRLTREMTGDVVFRQLTFRYSTRKNVFEGLNLSIPKSSVTAIVGESGSGKSTLISILQGLYPIQEGQIYIGNYSMNHIDLASLRKLLGVVPQKIDLFAGNVTENIALGDDYPDMRRVIQVCQELDILEFIEKLPAGFNTCLGENGATLSGGQKQRISIARALYRDPEILILDEATSSLDSAAEQYVHRAIEILRRQGKTVILIAHRLSTVMEADKIIVLDDGKLVEEGTHAELLCQRSKYFQLWNYQMPLTHDMIQGQTGPKRR